MILVDQASHTLVNHVVLQDNFMKRCRDECRISLPIAGVVLVPAFFYIFTLPPCHPYITINFIEIIFTTCMTENKDSSHK